MQGSGSRERVAEFGDVAAYVACGGQVGRDALRHLTGLTWLIGQPTGTAEAAREGIGTPRHPALGALHHRPPHGRTGRRRQGNP